MRVKIEISYNGENFSGFQIQKNKRTIQGEIESVLFSIFGQVINIISSGRTDAGVSAIKQLAHFDLPEKIDVSKLYRRMNSMLPNDIRILSSVEMDDNWHARYSAKKKTYCYKFYISEVIIPYLDRNSLNVCKTLDINEMRKACDNIIGEHDFSAFCAANTNVINKTRLIYDAKITKINEIEYEFEITGNGFLYNMVRIIVGTLLQIGLGKFSARDILKIIESKDRSKAGRTASSKGLYLKAVYY